ncbi:hypothetical protein ACFVVC_18330 [Pseudarthrobacter sp. NPDC058196]|uniref:hypothetical protein n=1 Tax=Pseudarthrobacter sp. NPDC058196 TaxID=3346376 RepID=UPI0036DE1474
MEDEEPWYSKLRKQWKPERVKLLMIAESAPADGGNAVHRNFFYRSDRLGPDNLFRGVVAATYGTTSDALKQSGKRPWLERLRDDGFYLIDLASHPVNRLGPAEKRQVLRDAVVDCVARTRQLDPIGVVIVKANLYPLLAAPLVEAGLPLLHDRPIPFPLGNTRAEFIAAFNTARSNLPVSPESNRRIR